jgi:nitrile hydratase
MKSESDRTADPEAGIVLALGEVALFRPGDQVRVANLSPVGHYRVPRYLRNKSGWVESVIEPRGIDNEEEGFGRNAGKRLHYYRIAIRMKEIWPTYDGPSADGLRIEVFETWLQRI